MNKSGHDKGSSGLRAINFKIAKLQDYKILDINSLVYASRSLFLAERDKPGCGSGLTSE